MKDLLKFDMEEKLRQLYKNRANAYLNTIDESVVQGMDDDCFIKTVNEAFALYSVVRQSEQLPCDHKQVLLVRHAAKCKDCGTVFETKW